MRPVFLAGLVVVVALVAGYATAGGGYAASQTTEPRPLTPVKAARSTSVTLAKVTVTRQLQPASRQTRTQSSTQTQGSTRTQSTQPTVRQPVTPTPQPTTKQPSGGGTFDSSG